jgi:hypothetical protein
LEEVAVVSFLSAPADGVDDFVSADASAGSVVVVFEATVLFFSSPACGACFAALVDLGTPGSVVFSAATGFLAVVVFTDVGVSCFAQPEIPTSSVTAAATHRHEMTNGIAMQGRFFMADPLKRMM